MTVDSEKGIFAMLTELIPDCISKLIEFPVRCVLGRCYVFAVVKRHLIDRVPQVKVNMNQIWYMNISAELSSLPHIYVQNSSYNT